MPMMTIQEKRSGKVFVSPGPGEYSIEKADRLTKSQSFVTKISSRLGRLSKQPDQANGPGTYNIESGFGRDLNQMTIGKRQESKTSLTVGPGSYNPHVADSVVKKSGVKTDFTKSSPRKTQKTSIDLGPGYYNTLYNFGTESPAMTIGVRLIEKTQVTAGPGQYDPQDSVTKNRTPVAFIPKSPARFEP